MDWLNYHHLLYFWVVAREGTIARACDQLHLTQLSISKQLHQLEHSVGERIFKRVGRNLVLTETGQLVFRYADEIFSLGRELSEALQGKPARARLRLLVGVADVVPKLIAYRVLEPALHLPEPVQLMCDERGLVELLTELAEHRLDLVLSDSPLPPTSATRAYNHLLGECSDCIFGSSSLARKFRRGFPQSLDGAPFLLPTRKSMLRRSLDQWFDSQNIRPELLGEFDDSALLKVFGQAGVGLFPGPAAVEKETCRHPQLPLEVDSLGANWTLVRHPQQFAYHLIQDLPKHKSVADEDLPDSRPVLRLQPPAEPPLRDLEEVLSMNEGREVHLS